MSDLRQQYFAMVDVEKRKMPQLAADNVYTMQHLAQKYTAKFGRKFTVMPLAEALAFVGQSSISAERASTEDQKESSQ